jgi:hypothetical protein
VQYISVLAYLCTLDLTPTQVPRLAVILPRKKKWFKPGTCQLSLSLFCEGCTYFPDLPCSNHPEPLHTPYEFEVRPREVKIVYKIG